MINKRDFRQGDDVVIYELGDDKEYRAKVVGKASENVIDVYIVELVDVPGGHWPWSHAAIPETCLRRV